MCQLFDKYAHRYDLHTSPSHYQHDHRLVIDLALERGLPCRMLDVGCGTGVLVKKARDVGIDAIGIDAAPRMVAVARQRLPENAVRVERMQDLAEHERYDLIVCLSWSLHYCADDHELGDILRRMRAALVLGGVVLLQVAHGENVVSEWVEDRETGPTGIPEDVVFRFRFRPGGDRPRRMQADYAYFCGSENEAFSETHTLAVTSASEISEAVARAGFDGVEIWDSWHRDPFATSASPFICGRKPLAASATATGGKVRE